MDDVKANNDREKRGNGRANIALLISLGTLVVSLASGGAAWLSAYNAYQQAEVAKKTLARAEENLSLSVMIDLSSPLTLDPPRRFADISPPRYSAPCMTSRWKVLLSNTSQTFVTIKWYQLGTVVDGLRSVYTGTYLETPDGKQVTLPVGIEPGHSISLVGTFKYEIGTDAYKLFKSSKVRALKEAFEVISAHDSSFFGGRDWPILSIRAETSRGKSFSWHSLFNGNDLL